MFFKWEEWRFYRDCNENGRWYMRENGQLLDRDKDIEIVFNYKREKENLVNLYRF